MPLTLHDLHDGDGLVSMDHVALNSAQPREMRLKVTGQPVFANPNTFGVVDFVVPRPDLVKLTKLMLQENQMGLKRLPIFGIQFDKGLEKAAEASPGTLLKSMYKATNTDGCLDYGTCATLVTHIQKTSSYVQIEAWQILGVDSETFYIHGMLDATLQSFFHLDGATMQHCEQEAETLFLRGTKVKGSNYQKWFRLDGQISRRDAIAIAKAYFPIEALLAEYLEEHTEGDA